MTECIDLVRREIGDLSEKELDQVLEEMRARQARLIQNGADPGTAAAKAGRDLADTMRAAMAIERRNAAINLRIRTEALDYIRTTWGDDPAEGIFALLYGSPKARFGSRASANAAQDANFRKYTAGVAGELEQAGLFDVLRRGEMDRDVARAMWSIGDEAALAKLPTQAVDIAKILHKWQEVARLDGNRHGGWIGKLDNYVVRQSHHPDRLAKAGEADWKAKILPRLDMAKTFPDGPPKNLDDWLHETFLNLTTGVRPKGAADLTAERMGAFKGPGNLAKRLSQERVLHFKSADDWFDYNAEFGFGNLREAYVQGLHRAAESNGLMQVLGTNPEYNLDAVVTAIRSRLSRTDPKQLAAFDAKTRAKGFGQSRIANAYAEISGATRRVASDRLATVGAGLRVWNTLTGLGGAVVSAITDVPIRASALRYQGQSYLGALAEGVVAPLKRIVGATGGAERQATLNAVGYFNEMALGNLASRFSPDESVPGRLQKATHTFFKWNLLGGWTDELRRSSLESMARFFGETAGTEFGALSERTRRTCERFRIGAGEWDVIRKGLTEESAGDKFLTPQAVRELPRTHFAELAKDRINALKSGLLERVQKRQAADVREREWVDKRSENLRAGLARANERLSDRIGTIEGSGATQLRELQNKLAGLYDHLDTSQNYWDGVREHRPSIGEMRREGMKEARARAQASESRALRKRMLTDLESVKGDLDEKFFENMRQKIEDIPPVVRRLNRDQELRAELAAMRDETGWAEVGGRVLMDDDGRVLGRSSWIPRAEWWPERPKGLKEDQVQGAIDKALAGERLTKREIAMIDYMAEVSDTRKQLSDHLPTKDELRAEEFSSIDDAYESALVARASEINDDFVERTAQQFEDDADGFLKAIKEFVEQNQATGSRGAPSERAPAKEVDDFELDLGEVFKEAKAALTARKAKLEGAAAERLTQVLEKLGRTEVQFTESAGFWQRMRDAEPKVASLRGAGVSEGRARESARNLKSESRQIGRDLDRLKKELNEDFIERWSDRQDDLVAFAERTSERIAKRAEQTAREFGDLEPQIDRILNDTRETTADKLQQLYADEVNSAVISPDARTLAFVRQGQQAGTPIGEALRLFWQFKTFGIAIMQRAFLREFYGYEKGRGGSLGTSEMRGLAILMAGSTAFGYLAMSAKDMIKGRSPRPPDDYRTWQAAMAQGGGAGIYGDFMFAQSNRFGQGFLQTLGGPTVSKVDQVYQLWNSVKAGDDVAAKAVKFGISNTPYANLFYTRMAMDYLFLYELQESLNPGYLRRMERKVEEDTGSEWWLRPSEVAN